MKVFKRSLSFILCLVLLFTATFANFTVSADEITTAFIEGTGVRVRTGPSTQHSIIEQISNTNATVIGSQQVGNDIWYQITYHNGTEQITGYIFYDPSYIRIVTYNPTADFETKLEAFPESYRDALRALHSKYPDWEFIPDTVTTSFWDSVALQSVNMRKQVSFTSHPVSWRSMVSGSYSWSSKSWILSNGGWTGASREIIAHYMDPRNFLNESEIYMFLQQGYNAANQTEEGVNKIIAGTFMATNYSDPDDTAYGGSYAKVIMEAARQSGVSPYILASKIRQEIGVAGTSSLISGTTSHGKYFNFFNIGASGSNDAAVIANGLARAKAEGWTTRSASIIGGAKFLSDGYISAGQDTYYLQDFNVHQPDRLWHQYAQAVHDARSKGVSLAKTYQEDGNYPLTFRIPIFPGMPESVCEKPVSSGKTNNYYFEDVSIGGLSPSFSMFNYNYALYLSDNAVITVKPVENATYAGAKEFNLKKGENVVLLKVKSETGYIMDYAVNITAEKDCVLTVNSGEIKPVYRKGDTNGDNQITVADLANVRLHLLGLFTLSGEGFAAADSNTDGKITVADLANIRLHLLGLYTIS